LKTKLGLESFGIGCQRVLKVLEFGVFKIIVTAIWKFFPCDVRNVWYDVVQYCANDWEKVPKVLKMFLNFSVQPKLATLDRESKAVFSFHKAFFLPTSCLAGPRLDIMLS